MKLAIGFITFAVTFTSAPVLLAQGSSAFRINSLMLAPTDSSSPAFPPSAITMITNRSKHFADRISPSGRRYVSLTNDVVHGKSNDQLLQILSPTISATRELRAIDTVVNITQPLNVFAKPNEPVNIVTPHLTNGSAITHLDIRSTISLSGGVTIRRRRQ